MISQQMLSALTQSFIVLIGLALLSLYVTHKAIANIKATYKASKVVAQDANYYALSAAYQYRSALITYDVANDLWYAADGNLLIWISPSDYLQSSGVVKKAADEIVQDAVDSGYKVSKNSFRIHSRSVAQTEGVIFFVTVHIVKG